MSIATSRADAVRKYFTKTPIEPKLPDYSKHRINMVLGAVLLFVSLFLFLTREGMPVLLGVAAAYFGLLFWGKGSSKYFETKKKIRNRLRTI